MSYTRANVEMVLVGRRSAMMGVVGFAITFTGSNASLNDPISFAVRALGGTVVNTALVTDADIQTLDEAKFDALLDVAELRLLRNIKGNMTAVDTVSGPFQERFSQLIDSIRDDIAAMEKKIEAEYGIGGVDMTIGKVKRDFASHGDDTI